MTWINLKRPGYFGRKRDEKIKGYNDKYGEGNWRLRWVNGTIGTNAELYKNHLCEGYSFEGACKLCYEESYFQFLIKRREDIEFICSYGECIDNAMTNIQCGTDYSKQEAYSTHIQDIAVRNVLKRLGVWFNGHEDKILVIRSKDSEGFKFGPGNIPFYNPNLIMQPSKCPKWANKGSVEDFWQSNKWIQIKQ